MQMQRFQNKNRTGLLIILCMLAGVFAMAQKSPAAYLRLIKTADNHYRSKNYSASAKTYTQAFRLVKWQGEVNDHYNAACSWALAGIPDSAFFHLKYMVSNYTYTNLEQVISEHDLESLHKKKEWKSVIEAINQNISKREARKNNELTALLVEIREKDQSYRAMIDSVVNKYGRSSDEIKTLAREIRQQDSINLSIVSKIIDTAGWLGPDVISEDGNTTLFLVIQHADQKTQEHYLPIMRDAVKKGNANASALALLEDRVALGQGKKQIYGSQIVWDEKKQTNVIAPIEDEPNVDKRRASVGLEPLADYVSYWGIVYKKQEASPATTNKQLPAVDQKLPYADMANAIVIQDSIAGPFYTSKGFGAVRDYNSHVTGKQDEWYGAEEENSAWFKFSIDHDTTLVFDIVPEDYQNDFDFFLFRCNSDDCENMIRTNALKPERFCMSVNEAKFGSTGISEYGTRAYIGGGNGQAYNSTIKLKAGETYYLLVNYSEYYYKMEYKKKPRSFMIYFYNYWPKKPAYLKHAASPASLGSVLFESGKTVLTPQAKQLLDKTAEDLQKRTSIKLELKGYTDDKGDEAKNKELSEMRAKAVMDYLIAKKISSTRLSIQSYGSSNPAKTNETEIGREQNRRVELFIKN